MIGDRSWHYHDTNRLVGTYLCVVGMRVKLAIIDVMIHSTGFGIVPRHINLNLQKIALAGGIDTAGFILLGPSERVCQIIFRL